MLRAARRPQLDAPPTRPHPPRARLSLRTSSIPLILALTACPAAPDRPATTGVSESPEPAAPARTHSRPATSESPAGSAEPVPSSIFTSPVPPDIPPSPAPSDTFTAPVPGDIKPPPGLVDLRLVLPGACFDIRYATADNFTGAPLPGYSSPGAWLRERPAAALRTVLDALRDHGLTLLIHDAYRPARASLAMVDWAERTGQRRLLDDGYIARRSGHNRGDTVDLTLARPGTCEPLDLGSAWDHFGPESHYPRAIGLAMQRRRLLRSVMRAAGFTPYEKEWWHFTRPDPGAAPLDVPYPAR